MNAVLAPVAGFILSNTPPPEFNPDTVISLANGEKLLVRDTPDEIVARSQEYKRSVLAPPVRERRGEVTALRAVD